MMADSNVAPSLARRRAAKAEVKSSKASKGRAPMRDNNSEGARSPMARKLPGVMRSSNSEGAKSPMAKKLTGGKARDGGGLDLGKFAREVSTNYGRGVAEVGRQLGSVKLTNPLDRAGRTDPLAGRSVQNAVDFGSRTSASNNPLKKILAGGKSAGRRPGRPAVPPGLAKKALGLQSARSLAPGRGPSTPGGQPKSPGRGAMPIPPGRAKQARRG